MACVLRNENVEKQNICLNVVEENYRKATSRHFYMLYGIGELSLNLEHLGWYGSKILHMVKWVGGLYFTCTFLD